MGTDFIIGVCRWLASKSQQSYICGMVEGLLSSYTLVPELRF